MREDTPGTNTDNRTSQRSAEDIAHDPDVLAAGSPGVTLHCAIEAGRNDPCPCGTGKKYKRCCGAPRSRGYNRVLLENPSDERVMIARRFREAGIQGGRSRGKGRSRRR